jgi:hypothetical protein
MKLVEKLRYKAGEQERWHLFSCKALEWQHPNQRVHGSFLLR